MKVVGLHLSSEQGKMEYENVKTVKTFPKYAFELRAEVWVPNYKLFYRYFSEA